MLNTKKLTACLVVTVAIGAASAPAASASTKVGSECAANAPVPNYTLAPLGPAPGSSLPLTAPSAGIVTQWSVNNTAALPPGFPVSEKLKVLRPTGAPNTFQTVGESAAGLLKAGPNTVLTRIPVQAGDSFGVAGTPGSFALMCQTPGAMGLTGIKEGDVAPGSSATYAPIDEYVVGVAATIEADADNDGFGDESQDFCPQNAALQKPCPVLILDAINLPPGKTSVKVMVVADAQSEIAVSASAKVPKAKGKGTTTTQLDPVVQLVRPGSIAIYTINFNKALMDALKKLSKKKTISLDIVADGKGPSGASSVDRLAVKVKGQAKPKKRKKAKG
jgi:hypothetical protein